jgi:uncharacterized protein YjbI with pentapeptide repeats
MSASDLSPYEYDHCFGNRFFKGSGKPAQALSGEWVHDFDLSKVIDQGDPNAEITNCEFYKCDGVNARICETGSISKTLFHCCKLDGASFSDGSFDRWWFVSDLCFNRCHLKGAGFKKLCFKDGYFEHCDLREADFSGCSFSDDCYFNDCDLRGAKLPASHDPFGEWVKEGTLMLSSNCSVDGADLSFRYIELRFFKCCSLDFSKANIEGVSFGALKYADLKRFIGTLGKDPGSVLIHQRIKVIDNEQMGEYGSWWIGAHIKFQDERNPFRPWFLFVTKKTMQRIMAIVDEYYSRHPELKEEYSEFVIDGRI